MMQAKHMMKLLTLQGSGSFASDALYRLESRMEPYGLYADDVSSYGSVNELMDAAVMAVEDGIDIIVAVDKEQFLGVKHTLSGRLMLEEDLNPDVAEAVSMLLGSEYTAEPIDMTEQSLLPKDSQPLLTNDGLYSGFCWMGPSDSMLWYVALDYSRIDGVVDTVIDRFFKVEDDPEPAPVASQSQRPRKPVDYDFIPAVTKLVYSLVQLDKRVALCDGEAVSYIKPLTENVQSFGEVTYFVGEDRGAQYKNDDPQSRVVQCAREALTRTYADFGGAVSELVLTEENGRNIYSAFVAVVNREGAQVKKITTDKPEDIDLLMPHAASLLIDTLCKKADIIANDGIKSRPPVIDENDELEHDLYGDSEPKKKMSMSMVIIAVLVGIIAIGSAVGFAISYAGSSNTTTSISTTLPFYSTTASTTLASSDTSATIATTDVLASSDVNAVATLPANTTTDPYYSRPAEPAAPNISATQTTTTVASEKGTFTFYVFGYGHGVGLSQRGAEYCAKNYGWKYDQILANYFYGTTLVIGDSYPKEITYAGTSYKIRDFLASALETEIGSTFDMEAMKAQVVALYTYAKYYGYKLSTTGCAYGNKPTEKAYKAVDAVIGQYLMYNGSTALTPFHAISAGKTTAYYNVWGGDSSTAISYLEGGRPSYGDYEAPDFATTYTISSEDFKTLAKSRSNIELTGDPATWITIRGHDNAIDANTGYVSTIQVGGEMFSGYKFRTDVMGGAIRSHCFKLVYTPDLSAPASN